MVNLKSARYTRKNNLLHPEKGLLGFKTFHTYKFFQIRGVMYFYMSYVLVRGESMT